MADPDLPSPANCDVRRKSTGGRAPQRVVTHEIPFQANDGSPAVMVFHSGVSVDPLEPPTPALPGLYSFALYVTSPNASPTTFNSAEAYDVAIQGAFTYVERVRLDVYFLPGASVDACMAHYAAEKTHRGTFTRQVEALERGDPPANAGGLPGLVPSYLDLPSWWHHDVLLVNDKDWKADGMLFVQFNRAEREECHPYEDELDDVPRVIALRYPVGQDRGHSVGTIERCVDEIKSLEDLRGLDDVALELGYTTW